MSRLRVYSLDGQFLRGVGRDDVAPELAELGVEVEHLPVPGDPGREAARRRFLAEHAHDDDETRWFVAGGGLFWLRGVDRVWGLACGVGDWLRLPAGTRHWFDMGHAPDFCAVRWFTGPDGWVARYTGDPIARRFPEAP